MNVPYVRVYSKEVKCFPVTYLPNWANIYQLMFAYVEYCNADNENIITNLRFICSWIRLIH